MRFCQAIGAAPCPRVEWHTEHRSDNMAAPCRDIVERRSRAGSLFFTVTLADRSSDLLVRHVDRLRRVYASIQERYPFETIAICVLPDHLHVIWSLPAGDADFSLR